MTKLQQLAIFHNLFQFVAVKQHAITKKKNLDVVKVHMLNENINEELQLVPSKDMSMMNSIGYPPSLPEIPIRESLYSHTLQ